VQAEEMSSVATVCEAHVRLQQCAATWNRFRTGMAALIGGVLLAESRRRVATSYAPATVSPGPSHRLLAIRRLTHKQESKLESENGYQDDVDVSASCAL
jgi:hypothetical protein